MKKLMAGLVIFSVFTLVGCKPKEQKEALAKVDFISGAVSVNGKDAHVGDSIKNGDVIETGDNSTARLRLDKKTMVQIKKNSRLVYKIPQENTLYLERGWMSGITKAKFTKSGSYTIKTPTVAAAVRGTSYCLKVENPKSTYFCTCNGTIHQHGLHDEDHAEDVSTPHHAGRRYVQGEDGKIAVKTAGMEFHTDQDLEDLAKTIDETIDWTKVQ